MTQKLWTVAACAALGVWASTARTTPLGAGIEPLSRAAADEKADLTPPPGSPVRKAVLDALRTKLEDRTGLEVEFVVRDLKVKDGWAWVHTLPQSPGGQSRFEDVLALLKLEDGRWAVVDLPCTEPENPDCLDGPDYFSRLLGRFPEVPPEILPKAALPTPQLSADECR